MTRLPLEKGFMLLLNEKESEEYKTVAYKTVATGNDFFIYDPETLEVVFNQFEDAKKKYYELVAEKLAEKEMK